MSSSPARNSAALRNQIALLTFIVFALFLGLIILLQNLSWQNPLFAWAQRLPYHDKLGHFLLMGGLAFFAILALTPRLKSNRLLSSCKVAASITFIIALEEGSQKFFLNRTFSLWDFLASLLGIIVLGALAHLFVRKP